MYPECRHVKTDGGKCASPALAQNHWCYFHDRLHRRRFRALTGRPAQPPTAAPEPAAPQLAAPEVPTLELPSLEDAAAVQFALTDVLQALAGGTLDPRRAGLLLYGLQIAAGNSRHVEPYHSSVRTVTYAEDGSSLGPPSQGLEYTDIFGEDAVCDDCDEDCDPDACDCGCHEEDEPAPSGAMALLREAAKLAGR